jgi:uncharacterized membrane protein
MNKDQFNIILLSVLVIISRVFFIHEGYGIEEDSWGLVINSVEMSTLREYVMSRMPGHPFQEVILATFFNFNHSPEVYNGLSMLFSLFAAIYFYLVLKELKFKYPFLATLALVLTPVVYISSVYTIDYIWSLAFIIISYYYILRSKSLLAGILLGLATACRITSGALLIPFILTIVVYGTRKNFRNSIIFVLMCLITTALIYIPAFLKYGFSFFNYYNLPYPLLLKVLYKGTLGVLGTTASLVILIVVILFVFRQRFKPYKNYISKTFLI